jgi:mRNA interferase HigB
LVYKPFSIPSQIAIDLELSQFAKYPPSNNHCLPEVAEIKVRVISKKTLRLFWEDPKTPSDARTLLIAWYKVLILAIWHNFSELRQTFNSADQVGDCVVFNVGGNKYRVIGRVRYTSGSLPGVVYILKAMTHSEYDEDNWPDQCGCFNPPPSKSKNKKKRMASKRPTKNKKRAK